MLPIAYYLLKVVICSGILYGYYRLALHNKIFHRWNRFYLLGAVIMSLAFPLITISIFHTPAEDDGQVIRLLNVVTTGEAFVHEVDGNSALRLSGEEIASFIYLIVSLVFLALLFETLVRLRNIVKRHYTKNIEGIHFVDTEAKGTPFSFFNYIFWNRNININSETGRKVFLHELAHVKERHSVDRLFMNIVMIFFWSNPFFWLIRREMNMIHEFIADGEAVDNNDTAEFAAMILQVAYPQRSFGLTSNFFSSSVKRRLLMLTKMQTPRTSYISRVLVLPLLAIVFVAFTIRTKQMENIEPVLVFEKKINVVIDAGHGGTDGGARSRAGIFEKDITLTLAKKIRELNNNSNINIILTRSEDVFQPVKEKVDFAVKEKADAFIAIHVAATPQPSNTGRGFEIFLSRNADTASVHGKKARLLASIITEEIAKTYTIATEIKKRNEKGIWVLDADQINYPSLLIECGYLTDSKDLDFINNKNNQEKIARDILKAIERYTKALEDGTVSLSSEKEEQKIVTNTTRIGTSQQSDKKEIIRIEASAIDITGFIKNKPKEERPLFIIQGKVTEVSTGTTIYASAANKVLQGVIYPADNVEALSKFGTNATFGAVVINEVPKPATAGTTDNTNTQGQQPVAQWDAKAEENVVKMESKKLEVGTWARNKPLPLILLNGKETNAKSLENKTLMNAKYINYPANHPDAIEKFGARAANGIAIFEADEIRQTVAQKRDTIPQKIKSIDITNDGNVIVIYKNNRAEKMTREEAIKRKLINEPTTLNTSGAFLKGGPQLDGVLFFVDDKEVTKEDFEQLEPNDIESMSVYKGMNAIDKYGLRASKGAIDIRTKKILQKQLPDITVVAYDDRVFQKVEEAAKFPGGEMEWARYISKAINKDISLLKKENREGTCLVRFIVDIDGTISNVEALTMKGTQLAKSAIEGIKSGPKWIPAMQNGRKVKAYRCQPVSFSISGTRIDRS